MAWTDDRIATLKKLWDQGLTASQIATELGEGVTRNAVIGKAHRLELKGRPSPVKSDSKKAKAKKPKKAAKDSSKKLSLLDLTESLCKWPIGHPGEDDFHFCGLESLGGHPYCQNHCAEAYQAQAPRKNQRPAPSRNIT